MDSGEVAAEFILAAGSHDIRVADRAAELYLSGAAPVIVCSGGFGKVTGGIWNRPEGEVFAERCLDVGVPEEAVLIEGYASNSGENFTLSRDVLRDAGLAPKYGIIVSKPYMSRRAWATGSKQWPLDYWFVRPPKISFDDYPTEDTPLYRMINLMVGDLQRLDVYAKQGFQVAVDVPADVWAAYDRLVADGFDQFVIT